MKGKKHTRLSSANIYIQERNTNIEIKMIRI
ncbi:hypothetical protein OIU78_008083 [Salix suchowensis]|nr:hypothetical protein OIU78_008083 [Salix suchowensis]